MKVSVPLKSFNALTQVVDQLSGYLHEACGAGELCDDLDLEVATHELLILIGGISVERLRYLSRVPAEGQLQLLDRLLNSFERP